MTRFSAGFRGLCHVCICLWLVGCVPPPGAGDQSQAERYFGAGKARVQQREFSAAVAAFEQALLADPQMASAHYEMGMIFHRELHAPEKALYHFIRALELNPNLPGADLISNQLSVVRMTLARGATPALASPSLAAEIERLQRSVETLKDERDQALGQVDHLRQQLALLQRTTPTGNPPPGPDQPGIRNDGGNTGGPSGGTPTPPGGREVLQGNAGAATSFQAYVIQKGDTLYGLSRRFQVSQSELEAANPGLSVRNFPAGRTIQIPVK